jgi:hypothetical protein
MRQALYASFAVRIERHGDLLLLDVGFALDKIPVHFWVTGLSVAVFRNTDTALRIPSLITNSILVRLVHRLSLGAVCRMDRRCVAAPGPEMAGRHPRRG